MKRILIIFLAIVLFLGVIYWFWRPTSPANETDFEPVILSAEFYSPVATAISQRINELSPTPPTENLWILREVEFVPGTPFVYAVYHDTHNVFRILLHTGWQPYQKPELRRDYEFQLMASFEKDSVGWRLGAGEDGVVGQKTVTFTFDLKTQIWVERVE